MARSFASRMRTSDRKLSGRVDKRRRQRASGRPRPSESKIRLRETFQR